MSIGGPFTLQLRGRLDRCNEKTSKLGGLPSPLQPIPDFTTAADSKIISIFGRAARHIPLCNIKECKQPNIAKIDFCIVKEQLAIVSEQCSMLLHNSHATIYNYLLYSNIVS